MKLPEPPITGNYYGVRVGQVRTDASHRIEIKILDTEHDAYDASALIQHRDGSTRWVSAFKVSYRYPNVVKENSDETA